MFRYIATQLRLIFSCPRIPGAGPPRETIGLDNTGFQPDNDPKPTAYPQPHPTDSEEPPVPPSTQKRLYPSLTTLQPQYGIQPEVEETDTNPPNLPTPESQPQPPPASDVTAEARALPDNEPGTALEMWINQAQTFNLFGDHGPTGYSLSMLENIENALRKIVAKMLITSDHSKLGTMLNFFKALCIAFSYHCKVLHMTGHYPTLDSKKSLIGSHGKSIDVKLEVLKLTDEKQLIEKLTNEVGCFSYSPLILWTDYVNSDSEEESSVTFENFGTVTLGTHMITYEETSAVGSASS